MSYNNKHNLYTIRPKLLHNLHTTLDLENVFREEYHHQGPNVNNSQQEIISRKYRKQILWVITFIKISRENVQFENSC